MPPEELDSTLTALPLRVGTYVPDDLLEDWFAPGTGMNPVSAEALKAAIPVLCQSQPGFDRQAFHWYFNQEVVRFLRDNL